MITSETYQCRSLKQITKMRFVSSVVKSTALQYLSKSASNTSKMYLSKSRSICLKRYSSKSNKYQHFKVTFMLQTLLSELMHKLKTFTSNDNNK